MIAVLRVGHRIGRDKRITTHCALVARAFGANEIFIDTKDENIKKVVNNITKKFGGKFKIETGINSKKLITGWEGIIVHLTMYGEKLEKALNKIDLKKDVLIIIGSEKVPRFYYEVADYNISIGNQPHSEVAALAIVLDRINKGKWQTEKFNGKVTIMPSKKGKNVVSK